MKFLLDTGTCISYLRRRQTQTARRLADLAIVDVALCSVVKAELFYGVRRSSKPETEMVKLKSFLAAFSSLPFDDKAAEIYGQIRALLAIRGTLIGPNDLMIGAIAIANSLTLVTHNTREFSRIPDLKLEDWEAPLAQVTAIFSVRHRPQSKPKLSIHPSGARRLAITRQRLAGPRPAPRPAGLLEVARDPGCVRSGAVSDLAGFLGAAAIDYDARRLPSIWKKEFMA